MKKKIEAYFVRAFESESNSSLNANPSARSAVSGLSVEYGKDLSEESSKVLDDKALEGEEVGLEIGYNSLTHSDKSVEKVGLEASYDLLAGSDKAAEDVEVVYEKDQDGEEEGLQNEIPSNSLMNPSSFKANNKSICCVVS